MHLVLVACSAQKLDRPAAAADLYTSDLFTKASAYARAFIAAGRADAWRILSAKHGLIHPATPLEPYDVSLIGMDPESRRAWGIATAQQVLGLSPSHVTFLAGEAYRAIIESNLMARNIGTSVPVAHMGIGEQKAWLKAVTAQLAAAAEVTP